MSAVIISYQPLQIKFQNELVDIERVLTLPFHVTEMIVIRYKFVTEMNEIYYVLQGFRGDTPTIFIYNNFGVLQQTITVQRPMIPQESNSENTNVRTKENYIPSELVSFISSLESRFADEIRGNMSRGFSSTKVNKSLSADS